MPRNLGKTGHLIWKQPSVLSSLPDSSSRYAGESRWPNPALGRAVSKWNRAGRSAYTRPQQLTGTGANPPGPDALDRVVQQQEQRPEVEPRPDNLCRLGPERIHDQQPVPLQPVKIEAQRGDIGGDLLRRGDLDRRHRAQAAPAVLRRLRPPMAVRDLPRQPRRATTNRSSSTGLPIGTCQDALDTACGLYLNDPTAWAYHPTNLRPRPLRLSQSRPDQGVHWRAAALVSPRLPTPCCRRNW